jgi:hypothetical protein
MDMSTDLRTAAQQALGALEALQGGCTDHDDGTVEAITVWCPEVIDALRAALAQPPREPLSEGSLMGAYMDFDRTASKEWSSSEYLLHFARAIESLVVERMRGEGK